MKGSKGGGKTGEPPVSAMVARVVARMEPVKGGKAGGKTGDEAEVCKGGGKTGAGAVKGGNAGGKPCTKGKSAGKAKGSGKAQGGELQTAAGARPVKGMGGGSKGGSSPEGKGRGKSATWSPLSA